MNEIVANVGGSRCHWATHSRSCVIRTSIIHTHTFMRMNVYASVAFHINIAQIRITTANIACGVWSHRLRYLWYSLSLFLTRTTVIRIQTYSVSTTNKRYSGFFMLLHFVLLVMMMMMCCCCRKSMRSCGTRCLAFSNKYPSNWIAMKNRHLRSMRNVILFTHTQRVTLDEYFFFPKIYTNISSFYTQTAYGNLLTQTIQVFLKKKCGKSKETTRT